MNITLKKPCMYEGKEYTSLDLDFDGLTGQDLINATNEARALGDKSVIVELSKLYQAVLAARAAKVSSDMIIALPAKDFVTVTSAAQSFLIE